MDEKKLTRRGVGFGVIAAVGLGGATIGTMGNTEDYFADWGFNEYVTEGNRVPDIDISKFKTTPAGTYRVKKARFRLTNTGDETRTFALALRLKDETPPQTAEFTGRRTGESGDSEWPYMSGVELDAGESEQLKVEFDPLLTDVESNDFIISVEEEV